MILEPEPIYQSLCVFISLNFFASLFEIETPALGRPRGVGSVEPCYWIRMVHDGSFEHHLS
jgi:hypothetical protein